MPVESVLALYTLAHTLADRLPSAASDAGGTGVAEACVSGLAGAAGAVEADAGRVTADEVRAAKRLRCLLADLDGQPVTPLAAGVLSVVVKRYFGPRGLPASEEADFERLAASLRKPD